MAGAAEKKRLAHNSSHLRQVLLGNMLSLLLYLALRGLSVFVLGSGDFGTLLQWPRLLWNTLVMWLMYYMLNRAADRGHDISTSEAGSEYMTDLVYVSWAALVVGAVTGYANLLWLVVGAYVAYYAVTKFVMPFLAQRRAAAEVAGEEETALSKTQLKRQRRAEKDAKRRY